MGCFNKDLQRLIESQIEAASETGVDVHIHVHDGVTIMNYADAVPQFAGEWLDRLYGNIYSSLAHFRIYDGTAGVHTYIACRHEQVLAVLLYRMEACQAKILNEASVLPAAEVERFAQHIFGMYPDIDAISLHAVILDGEAKRFPTQRFNCLEDIVLRLPACTNDYLAALGKSTRAYLNRYQNKLRRDFPSASHLTLMREEIQEHHIHEILELNRSRMEEKGRLTPWTETDKRRMLEMAQLCGMVHLIMIDGRICAGTINYCINGNYFLEVIAHAPAYNDYGLGTLCCFATICQCIAQGGNEFHFLWGQSAYKYRLGGIQKNLEHVSVFRSRRKILSHPAMVLENLYRCYDRRIRQKTQQIRNGKGVQTKLLSGLIHILDALRLAWKRQTWLQPFVKRITTPQRSNTSGNTST